MTIHEHGLLLILDEGFKKNRGIILKFSNQNRMIIEFLGFLGFIFLAGCSHSASVDVDGWTFSADLGEQWRSDPHSEENGDVVGWSSTDGETPLFKGVKKSHAFWLAQEGSVVDLQDFPSYPHPKENGILAIVDIWVCKVPEEVQYWSDIDILSDYHGPNVSGGRRDIEFNGHKAILTEVDRDSDVVNDDGNVIIPASSIGQISILMTEDVIVAFDVVTTPEMGQSPWDIIEKIMISPTSNESKAQTISGDDADSVPGRPSTPSATA